MVAKLGRLTTIYGPMFSGKTTYLIQIFRKTPSGVVFKPNLDTRYTERPVVVAHTKDEIPATFVSYGDPTQLLLLVGQHRFVFIDEVNFFSPDLVEVVQTLLGLGISVYAAGLVYDTEQQVWGPMERLIALADEKIEVFARCDGEGGACLQPATKSYRKIPSIAQVQVGGAGEYGACCAMHYQTLHQSIL